MKVIGLTGGIASGKSTVLKVLKKRGAILLAADQIAHIVMEPHKPAWCDIVKTFGEDILDSDLYVNREKLGAIVFNKPEKMKALNSISHPRVLEYIEQSLNNIKKEDLNAIVVIEIPLLYEIHMEDICDEVWVVWIPREVQLNRLMKRNAYSREEALTRVESQMSLDEKAQRADRVINNEKSIAETIAVTNKYFDDISEEI